MGWFDFAAEAVPSCEQQNGSYGLEVAQGAFWREATNAFGTRVACRISRYRQKHKLDSKSVLQSPSRLSARSCYLSCMLSCSLEREAPRVALEVSQVCLLAGAARLHQMLGAVHPVEKDAAQSHVVTDHLPVVGVDR